MPIKHTKRLPARVEIFVPESFDGSFAITKPTRPSRRAKQQSGTRELVFAKLPQQTELQRISSRGRRSR